MSGLGGLLPGYAQGVPDLKRISPQFVTEAGCPIEVTGASSELELDPFGSPIAARHYIDYRNAGNRPVAAVRFRIGYVGADGKINQPYVNGDDQHPLQPGEQASKKWRGDKVDPRTSAVKIRLLKVKFADGGVWESVKLTETNAQQQEGFAPLTIESPGVAQSGDVFSGAGAQGAPPMAPPVVQAGGQMPMFAPPTAPGPVAGPPLGAAQMPASPPPPDIPPAIPAAPLGNAGMAAAGYPAAPQATRAAPTAFSAPPAAPPVAKSVAPPAAVAAPTAAPMPTSITADPMAALDQILGTGKPAAPPKAVAAPQNSSAPPAVAPELRPTLTPGAPDTASDTPAGPGDKPVELR